MSPVKRWNAGRIPSFPRPRGDEPRVYDMARAVAEFSPPTRG